MSPASALDRLDIPNPCTVAWSSMRGDERTRFCSNCRKHVFNISEMTREEAEDLIQAKNGQLCVRLYRRPDGTVTTADCIGASARWRRRLTKWVALSFAFLAALFVWAIWNARDRTHDRYDNWMRRTEPFQTVLEWIDPRPFLQIAGSPCPPPNWQSEAPERSAIDPPAPVVP